MRASVDYIWLFTSLLCLLRKYAILFFPLLLFPSAFLRRERITVKETREALELLGLLPSLGQVKFPDWFPHPGLIKGR